MNSVKDQVRAYWTLGLVGRLRCPESWAQLTTWLHTSECGMGREPMIEPFADFAGAGPVAGLMRSAWAWGLITCDF